MIYTDVIQTLHTKLKNLFQWFSESKTMANTDKCNFFCSSNPKANLTVENEETVNKACVKFLGVKINSKLTITTHLNYIC